MAKIPNKKRNERGEIYLGSYFDMKSVCHGGGGLLERLSSWKQLFVGEAI